MTVTFTKFNDTWALAADYLLTPGTSVAVTKRDGSISFATVGERINPVRDSAFAKFVFAIQAPSRAATPVAANVGDLGGVLALFAKAKAHLKFPKITLDCGDVVVRLGVAGPKARVPGSINVTDTLVNGYDDEGRPQHEWFGRVLTDGTYEPARNAASVVVDKITGKLRQLASDPAKVAVEYGRLHGNCCFCNRALDDERSTAVGYGKICAGHYGLPWGDAKHSFVAEEVSGHDYDGTEDYEARCRRDARIEARRVS